MTGGRQRLIAHKAQKYGKVLIYTIFLLFFFEKNEYIPHIAFNYLASGEKLGKPNEYTFTLHYKYTGVIAINIVIKLSLLHMNNAAKYINRLTI